MQDFQLYQQILGLVAPWRVEDVTLNVAAREVEVRVGYADTLWGCPECQQRMHVHDYEERRWRHLDSCQFQTILVARVPVVKCATHGAQTVAVPWAKRYARFTRRFERLAIDVLLECSITGACAILGVSWAEADGIKQRAVQRGLARKPPTVMPRLCVDENGMGRGPACLTIVAQVSADQTRVEWVGAGPLPPGGPQGPMQQPQGRFAVVAAGEAKLVEDAGLVRPSGAPIATVEAG